jgi:Ni/Co efflux regulator RcnB
MEDFMKKILVLVLLGVFATLGFAAQTVKAQEKKEKPAAAAKQERWHGTLLRFSTDTSSIDVRKGTNEKKIYYDSSTKWTKGTKTVDMSEFKEGSDVICLGKYDEKGEFHATRIDLRR